MQLIVVEDRLKHLRAVSLLGLLATIFLAVVATVAYHREAEAAQWFLWAGLGVALLQHWTVNFDEEKYREVEEPDDSWTR